MTDVVQKLWGFCNTLKHYGKLLGLFSAGQFLSKFFGKGLTFTPFNGHKVKKPLHYFLLQTPSGCNTLAPSGVG
jgi:hypothetical protein